MRKIENEPLINRLGQLIHYAVRVLVVLMTLVILWGVIDVGLILVRDILTPPYGLLSINDIMAILGSFLAVLIAIEIFQNITIYLKEEVIHVQIVIATALMAISRKIIILTFRFSFNITILTIIFKQTFSYPFLKRTLRLWLFKFIIKNNVEISFFCS